MKVQVINFEKLQSFPPEAKITLSFKDDNDLPFHTWLGKYKPKVEKNKTTYQITDFFNKEMLFASVIDWNHISEEVENKLLAFDIEYDIDIK